MHSIMMITVGLFLLAIFALAGHLRNGKPGMARAAVLFLPVWLLVSLGNLAVGVLSAGYTIVQEIPFLFIVFGIPAVIAWGIQRLAKRRA